MGRSSKKSTSGLPTVSVIIPIAPEGTCNLSLASVNRQDYDRTRIQILVAVGRHRSVQRNAALQKARGDIVWFMDNDVVVEDPHYLRKMVAYYAAAETASVGGPSLTLPTDSLLERAIGAVLGSYFATQSVRARYRPVGSVRRTNERELILCSQTFRRAFMHPKGFDNRLHSGNEENELMNRLDRSGRRLIYDPELCVRRSQRGSIREFVLQMAKYGKSRIEHFLIKPAAFEVLFLVPLGFALYLASLPLLLWWPGLPHTVRLLGLAPLFLYAASALVSALFIFARTGHPLVAMISLALFPLVHLGYAAGNVVGLFHRALTGGRAVLPVVVYSVRPGRAGPLPWEVARRGAQ